MKRRIATIAAAGLLLVGGATLATTASARDSFSLSIGVPGFGIGYANGGYYAPPVVYAPPAYAPYYGAPVVYGPSVVYSRPYYRPYYRPYRSHYWHR